MSLLKSPFFHELEYGANKEGYWNYKLVFLQLEDCVDVVKMLYPQYDFLFLFDHSCGHDKQREDGLNVNVMSKLYGGKQRILRTSKIKTHLGFLGKYPRTLNPGDSQKLSFLMTTLVHSGCLQKNKYLGSMILIQAKLRQGI